MPHARVGILTGAGGQAILARAMTSSTGGRQAVRRSRSSKPISFLHQGEEIPSRPGWDIDVLLHQRTKPIIAAIDGYCLGKGLIYVLQHTDIRIASDNAIFGLPEIAYGMAGASGSTRLAQQIPLTAAAWLALTGEFIDAAEALRVHLINKVVSPEKADAGG